MRMRARGSAAGTGMGMWLKRHRNAAGGEKGGNPFKAFAPDS